MKKVSIGGWPHLLGDAPGEFKKEAYHGLQVGDKIIQIGKPKITAQNSHGQTSSNRVDKFTPFIQYEGMYLMKLYEDSEEKDALAFRVLDPVVTGLRDDQYCYALYFPGIDELLLPNLDEGNIRIYKNHFVKYQE